jgi:hypothetical protein
MENLTICECLNGEKSRQARLISSIESPETDKRPLSKLIDFKNNSADGFVTFPDQQCANRSRRRCPPQANYRIKQIGWAEESQWQYLPAHTVCSAVASRFSIGKPLSCKTLVDTRNTPSTLASA